MEVEDSELLRLGRSGDRDALRQLYERYQRRLLSVVVGLVRNPEDAREIVQDTFVRAFRSLDGFKGDSSFYTWLYSCAAAGMAAAISTAVRILIDVVSSSSLHHLRKGFLRVALDVDHDDREADLSGRGQIEPHEPAGHLREQRVLVGSGAAGVPEEARAAHQ